MPKCLLIIVGLVLTPLVAMAEPVIYFHGGDNVIHKTINGYQMSYMNVNELHLLEKSLAANIHGSEDQILAEIDNRFNALSDEIVQTAVRPMFLANERNITKYPAFYFPQTDAVIYGVRNFPLAVAYYERWKSMRK